MELCITVRILQFNCTSCAHKLLTYQLLFDTCVKQCSPNLYALQRECISSELHLIYISTTSCVTLFCFLSFNPSKNEHTSLHHPPMPFSLLFDYLPIEHVLSIRLPACHLKATERMIRSIYISLLLCPITQHSTRNAEYFFILVIYFHRCACRNTR